MTSFSALYSAFASHPQGHWILKPESAIALHEAIIKHDIRNVLELGTGIGLSTAIIARALEVKRKPYTITTVEQFEKCHKLAQELIPEELRKNVTFHLTEAVAWSTPEIPYQYFSIFKELPEPPEGGWDFVVVDGPGPFLSFVENVERYVELPNGDVTRMHLDGKIKPGTLVYFDGRITALSIIERYFGDNFWLLDEAQRRSNVIERKDCEVKCEDWRRGMMERQGYFS